MDKSRINVNRTSAEYIKEVESCLDFAFSNAGDSKVIICPCNRCKVGVIVGLIEMKLHTILCFMDFGLST